MESAHEVMHDIHDIQKDDGTARCQPETALDKATHATPPGGEAFCGVAKAAAILGDTWTLLIIRDLADGPRRFGELQTSTGVGARMLTDRLRAMHAAGLVTRTMYAEIPPRVEYELTEEGHDAVAVVNALRAFGEKWLHGGQ